MEGIGLGTGTFAQHVVAEAQARLFFAGAGGLVLCFGNGLAQHKLAAQQLHRAQGGGHHGACAQAHQQAGLLAAGRVGQQFFGQGNGAAGETGQRAAADGCAVGGVGGLTTVIGMGRLAAVKVGTAQLVGGEGHGGFGIGHAQQGFGQAHQGQALGAGDGVFLQQALHRPERRRVVAHGLHPGGGGGHHGGPVESAFQSGKAVGQHAGFGAVGVGQAHGGISGKFQ